MAIPPILRTGFLDPPASRWERAASGEETLAVGSVPTPGLADPAVAQRVTAVEAPAELVELRKAAAEAQMEVEMLELPDSKVVLYRLVEPGTGRVMREFPPEALTETLAALRAQASGRINERA